MKRFSDLFAQINQPRAAPADAVELPDSQNRYWPTVPIVPRRRADDTADAVESIAVQLAHRCAQIADLHDLSKRQASELMASCNEIDRLSRIVTALDERVTQTSAAAALREKEFSQIVGRNNLLLEALDTSRQESVMLLGQLLTLQTDYNNQNIAMVCVQEKHDQIVKELALAQAEKIQMCELLESAKRNHHDELEQLQQKCAGELRESAEKLKRRDSRIKKLGKRRSVFYRIVVIISARQCRKFRWSEARRARSTSQNRLKFLKRFLELNGRR